MKTAQKYKICRRLGSGVFEKCQTPKFVASEARHGKNLKGKKPKMLSGFATQFIEKQKVRFMYGLSEKQFSNYVSDAVKQRAVPATEALFESLESRLDNVAYRLGLAHTRRLSRQMASHGHFTVNGKKTTIPSYKLRVGDVIAVREGSKKSTLFANIAEKMKEYTAPNWLSFKVDTLSGKVEGKAKDTEGFLDLNTVLEFYSR